MGSLGSQEEKPLRDLVLSVLSSSHPPEGPVAARRTGYAPQEEPGGDSTEPRDEAVTVAEAKLESLVGAMQCPPQGTGATGKSFVQACYGLSCVPPKFIRWSPNPEDLRR